jgi:hypothetical protein
MKKISLRSEINVRRVKTEEVTFLFSVGIAEHVPRKVNRSVAGYFANKFNR